MNYRIILICLIFTNGGFGLEIKSTNQDLRSLVLESITDGSIAYRNLSWSNITYDSCSVTYRMFYWVKNNKKTCKQELKTNSTNLYLDGLDLNLIYEAQVESYSNQSTYCKMSNLSNIQTFSTGNSDGTTGFITPQWSLIKMKDIIRIDVDIDPKLALSVYEYDVVFRDSETKSCYQRYSIKNDCFNKPACANLKTDLLFQKNNFIGKNEKCQISDTDSYCIIDIIEFILKDKSMKLVTVDIYGRTYFGWQEMFKMKFDARVPTEVESPELIVDQENNFIVLWEKPRANCYYQDATAFKVYLLANDTQIVKVTNQNYCKFTNMNPCTRYCVKVAAINEYGESRQSNIGCKTTLMPSIKNFSIILTSTNSIIISWDIEPNNCGNCKTNYYEIYVTDKTDISATFKTTKTFHSFQNMRPNFEYCFRVRIFNAYTESILSEKVCGFTLK